MDTKYALKQFSRGLNSFPSNSKCNSLTTMSYKIGRVKICTCCQQSLPWMHRTFIWRSKITHVVVDEPKE